MTAGPPDPTVRFTDRVADYERFRPSYPGALFDFLVDACGLAAGSPVADVGSGTGISTGSLLRRGMTVFAVEPNAAMRGAAERRLGGTPGFHSIAGTAEATGLPAASVDLVTAAQAFHWFDPGPTRREFARILRPPRRVALFWNERLTNTPFLRDYEALLHEFSTDYATVDHRHVGPDRVRAFFRSDVEHRTFPNEQVFDRNGLRGRLLSSSYTPAPGQPRHNEMVAALHRIFDAHQREGLVRFAYETHAYVGRLG